MYENVKKALIAWNSSSSQRQKLQHTYLASALLVVVVAGVVSLVEPEAGQDMVRLAVFALMVFLANAVVWNLLQSVVLSRLVNSRKDKSPKA